MAGLLAFVAFLLAWLFAMFGGPGGSLARLAPIPLRHKVYIHINNTNPMLIDDSPERQAVRAGGAEVGCDGGEFRL